MRWRGALALALGLGGVAGAILNSDWDADFIDGSAQVAFDVSGEGLEWRDVECV